MVLVYYMFITARSITNYVICVSSAIYPDNPAVTIGFGTARTEAWGSDY